LRKGEGTEPNTLASVLSQPWSWTVLTSANNKTAKDVNIIKYQYTIKMAITLKEGDKAPDFKGLDQNAKEVSLSDFKGKKVVLYFYPKDDTPGCTKEACNLRDNHSELLKKGFAVVGISPDDSTSHQKFIKKYELPFSLLADTEKTIMKAYGAWGEKNMYGKIVEGVLRSTFVIDENAVLLKVFKKVQTETHTEQILKALEK